MNLTPITQDEKPLYDQHGTGSVCGPENYAGGEWSRRYTYQLKSGHYLTITEYAAVIDARELYNRTEEETDGYNYAVEGHVEMIEHTDPNDIGGTETNSDYTYGEESGNASLFAYRTVEEAEAEAKRIAANMSADYYTVTEDTTI